MKIETWSKINILVKLSFVSLNSFCFQQLMNQWRDNMLKDISLGFGDKEDQEEK